MPSTEAQKVPPKRLGMSLRVEDGTIWPDPREAGENQCGVTTQEFTDYAIDGEMAFPPSAVEESAQALAEALEQIVWRFAATKEGRCPNCGGYAKWAPEYCDNSDAYMDAARKVQAALNEASSAPDSEGGQ